MFLAFRRASSVCQKSFIRERSESWKSAIKQKAKTDEYVRPNVPKVAHRTCKKIPCVLKKDMRNPTDGLSFYEHLATEKLSETDLNFIKAVNVEGEER